MSLVEFKYFFSYAPNDWEFVLKLAKELRANGVKLWLDQLDVRGSKHRDRDVEKLVYLKALKKCKGALVILSPESVASDKVMVIVSPGYFELESVVQIGKTVQEVQELFNPSFSLLGFLFTMSDPTVNSRTSLQLLRQTYHKEVFAAVIPRNTDIRDAHFEKKDIFDYNPNAAAAMAYKKLIREVFV